MTRTLFPETTSVTTDFILGDSTWNFFQVGYPVDTPTDIVVTVSPCGHPYSYSSDSLLVSYDANSVAKSNDAN